MEFSWFTVWFETNLSCRAFCATLSKWSLKSICTLHSLNFGHVSLTGWFDLSVNLMNRNVNHLLTWSYYSISIITASDQFNLLHFFFLSVKWKQRTIRFFFFLCTWYFGQNISLAIVSYYYEDAVNELFTLAKKTNKKIRA